MNRKIIPASVAAALAATGIGLAACGGSSPHHAAAAPPPTSNAPAAPSKPQPTSPPAPTMTSQTDNVVFSVTGSGEPSIQYGTDSSQNTPGSLGPLGNGNALPWSASMPYSAGALYYVVDAQLQGSGSIQDSVTEVITTTCSNGHTATESFPLASGNASGGYGIATAQYNQTSGADGNALQAETNAGC